MKEKKTGRTLIHISEKTFIQVAVLLFALMAVAAVLTYVLPKGAFGTLADGSPNYAEYVPLGTEGGIPVWKALLAPVLVFASSDGLTLIMLTLFLLVISASFQVMNDVGGVRALVGAVADRFREKRVLLLVLISFLFYSFGAFLGLFEEMLTMLPIVSALTVLLGYDAFTGFILSILSCGFGFAGAITNPFTVLLASEIIGVSPLTHVWYRIVIFLVMFGLLQAFLFLYLRRIRKDPSAGCTLQHDEELRRSGAGEDAFMAPENAKRLRTIYTVFLLTALGLIVLCSISSALRGYTVVFLTAYFLIFGILAGVLAGKKPGFVLKSFLRGIGGAAPTIVFIALAASIKYVFEEGQIMPTIVHQINLLVEGKSPILVALVIYLIVLLLEFFISSSTAKAILVMGLLSMVTTGLTKPMLVLLYTFADGYTNVLFPTSPVLLISLSMIGMDYFKWVRKSFWLFLVNFALVLVFIVLGVLIGF